MEHALETIVCATDLASESRGAETAAVFLAKKFNTNLQFITCDETRGRSFLRTLEAGGETPEMLGVSETWSEKNYDDRVETMQNAIYARILNLCADFPRQKIKAKVRSGSSAGIVLEEIKDCNPAKTILVIGKRHKGKIEKILLGSVSQRIITESHVPVLVVPEDADLSEWPPKNVVAATSLRSGSQDAEILAATLAEQFAASLHLVHIYEPPQPYFFLEPQIAGAGGFDFIDYAKLNEQLQHQRTIELQHRLAILAKIAPQISSTLKSGVVVDELLQFVTLQRARLLVLGSHAGGGFKRFFLGGKTLQVSQRCAVPLLIVRHHDFAIH